MKRYILDKINRNTNNRVESYSVYDCNGKHFTLDHKYVRDLMIENKIAIEGLTIAKNNCIVPTSNFRRGIRIVGGNTAYKDVTLASNAQYGIYLSMNDLQMQYNSILHLRDTSTNKIVTFEKADDLLVELKKIKPFMNSLKKALKEEAISIRESGILNKIVSIKTNTSNRVRLKQFYANCYAYFLIKNDKRIGKVQWGSIVSDGNIGSVIIKNASDRVNINSNYILEQCNPKGYIGIKVDRNDGLAVYGNPHPLVNRIYSSAYMHNQDLEYFVNSYYTNVCIIDEMPIGYYLTLRRLVEIMCNI